MAKLNQYYDECLELVNSSLRVVSAYQTDGNSKFIVQEFRYSNPSQGSRAGIPTLLGTETAMRRLGHAWYYLGFTPLYSCSV